MADYIKGTQIELCPCPDKPEDQQAEEHVKAAMVKGGIDGPTLDQARAAGISLPSIIALLVQYGPLFMQALKDILAALNTPVPSPKPPAS